MQTAADALFKTLADPTRRAIFERLALNGEQTVRVLAGHSASQSRQCRNTSACSSPPAWCATAATGARRITAPTRKGWRR
jgi:hypothetical protein